MEAALEGGGARGRRGGRLRARGDHGLRPGDPHERGRRLAGQQEGVLAERVAELLGGRVGAGGRRLRRVSLRPRADLRVGRRGGRGTGPGNS